MSIQCDQITQEGNRLIAAFDGCKTPKNSDLVALTELILAVHNCANGGDPYNTLMSDTYDTEQDVVYPVRYIHSYSLSVLEGSMEYEGSNFPAGSTRNVEFSTTNAKEIKFTVNPGSKVFFEYQIEDIVEP